MDATERVLAALEDRDLLARTGSEPPAYLPARPLETTKIADVLHAVRMANESSYLSPEKLPREHAVKVLLDDIDAARTAALGGKTFKDLALSDTEPCSGPKSDAKT